ncbi:MAG: hypothetical protein ABL909_06865 [Sphingopyxis sp.]
MKLTISAVFFALSLSSPSLAQNANAVSLNSDVMVERTTTDANGRSQVTLEEPRMVVPGDHLVFVLRYRNNGAQPAGSFVVTNPLPSAVAFQGTADTSATVSVDGGRNWGTLSTLEISNQDGTKRPARSEDVTHIRWAFAQPIPAGQAGRLMFRGIVR